MERRNVWSKDFTLIIVGTIISAIGGQTISLPMSLLVFDETGSTLLSAFLFISGMIPSVVLPILIAPVVDRFPKKRSIVGLDYLLGIIYLIVAATFELFITNIHINTDDKKFDFKEYKEDLVSGFKFLKKEKGIRNIYTYMGITNGTSHGSILIIQAYFQTVSFLTVTMLAFLRSAETIGRIIGGAIQYKVKVEPEKRYGITKIVYTVYSVMDGILLFMPLSLNLLKRIEGSMKQEELKTLWKRSWIHL